MTESGPQTPETIYRSSRAAREADLARWSRLDGRLQKARLTVFAIGLGMAFGVFGFERIPFPWLALPAALFVALLAWHDRVLRNRDRAERALTFYERGLSRLAYRFAGQGTPGDDLVPEDHAYARDLDLFGRGSLFERICLARTRGGEETLARWLLAPAPPDEVVARQEAVRELTDRLDLREELCLLGEDLRSELQPAVLRSWGEAPGVGFAGVHRILAPIFATLSVATLAVWGTGVAGPPGPALFAVALAAQSAFAWRLRARVMATVRAVEGPTRELALLAQLLERIEAEPVHAPRLAGLQTRLAAAGHAPSAEIHHLRRLVELVDARRNAFFAPLGALLLWTTQLAMSVEAWRRRCGPLLGDWLDGLSEFEALISLAGYAFERPEDRFPAFAEEAPRFAARGLGHPLIPTERCVRNDLRLGRDPQVLIVSGSNMSGKSTLLRSVGVAAVLAQAGAPVCADALRLSPLAVGASLHVVDSLQEGASHFYAEIRRVRQIVELADGPLPLLFLLDEIFHGTNSHDRGIGAEAILRALLERGAIGLVTTHDLALTRIADALDPRVANVHFEDQIEEGRIVFDYRMRKGVVRKSNAVELMRSVGLPV